MKKYIDLNLCKLQVEFFVFLFRFVASQFHAYSCLLWFEIDERGRELE